MKKIMISMFAAMMATLLFAAVASAHVVVYPKETTQGAYEKFSVRVPSEKDGTFTSKVEVKIPEEADVTRVEPNPGWKYELKKDTTGKVTSVVWTAVGDGLASTEFTDFNLSGKVADKATSLVWKAYQTYKDGSVVEWVGAAGSDHPASVTTVQAKPATSADTHAAHDAASTDAGGNGGLALILSITACVLGLLSLLVALFKKAKA